MPGPLTALTFPTPADLLAAGWSAWWRDHKLPPSPDQILETPATRFGSGAITCMQEHSNHLTTRLGDRLLPLYDLVIDLVGNASTVAAGNFPTPRRRTGIDRHLDCVGTHLPALDSALRRARPTRSDLCRRQRISAQPATAAGHHAARTPSCSTAAKPNRSLAPARPILKSRPALPGSDGQELWLRGATHAQDSLPFAA